MRTTQIKACLLFLVFFASGAQAQRVPTPLSTFHLYKACAESNTNEYARGFCDGAIDALYSSIDEWCVPERITHGEVNEQVKHMLREQYQSAPEDALQFVEMAIQQKWPCS